MSGWLKDTDVFSGIWKLKTIPGGWWLGAAMLVSSILGLVSDLVVAKLVQAQTVPSRCVFGQGLVVSTSGGSLTWSVPPANGRPFPATFNAQVTSAQNGGLVGIYDKVNSNTNFRAESQDVLAAWTCTVSSPDLSYDVDTPADSVIDDLVSRGLLYSAFADDATQTNGGFNYTHLTVWSSSADDDDNTPFDVKASIDLTANTSDVKTMRSFSCQTNNDGVDEILSQMRSASTLALWVPYFQGLMYDGSDTPAADDDSIVLEILLNSIVMIAGGSNNLIQRPTGATTQGCVIVETYISKVVIALAIVAGGLLIIMTLYWVRLRSRIRTFSKRGNTESDPTELLPNDLFSWMRQAARENALSGAHRVAPPAEVSELRDWVARVSGPMENRHVRLEHNGGDVPLRGLHAEDEE